MLRTWRADGSIRWDVNDRMSRVTGVINTGTTSGSVSVPSNLTAFYHVLNPTAGYPDVGPKITRSGSTVSWSFAGQTYLQPVTLIVGGY